MLTANQQEINLGNLTYGVPHSFKFVVVNTGSNDLEIVKLTVGCGSCTKASTDKRKLIPQEAAEINVVFTPGSSGAQTKNVSLFYNDNGVPKNMTLKFKAYVSG